MVSISHLTDEAAAVLAYLWDLDTRGGGYARRGVRGWARRENVEAGTRLSLPEVMPRLRGRRLVDEDQVQVPGTRAVVVYRITGLGDLLLSRRQRRDPRPPWPAGAPGAEDAAVYLAPGPSLALRLLREAQARGAPGSLSAPGPGWRTERELWEGWEAELGPARDWDSFWIPGDLPWRNPERHVKGKSPADWPNVFGRPDLEWLERAGLAESRPVTPPGRRKPITFWRATPEGVAITELQWHPPR